MITPHNIYDRFINNTVLNAIRRPQKFKQCAVVTIGSIVEVLINTHVSNSDIISQLKLDIGKIVGGQYGTHTIIYGVSNLSHNVIKHRILEVTDSESDWNMIKQCIRNGLIYYHSPGHHQLICGFTEEPLLKRHDIWNHENVDRDEYQYKRCSLVKAEHLVKKMEDIEKGMIISIEYKEIIKILKKHPHTNLVYFYI